MLKAAVSASALCIALLSSFSAQAASSRYRVYINAYPMNYLSYGPDFFIVDDRNDNGLISEFELTNYKFGNIALDVGRYGAIDAEYWSFHINSLPVLSPKVERGNMFLDVRHYQYSCDDYFGCEKIDDYLFRETFDLSGSPLTWRATAVPTPSAIGMLGLSLTALSLVRWRRHGTRT